MAESGHHLLSGKKGIIFGALIESSLAWAIAEAAHREGAEFMLSNAPMAKRLGKTEELAARTGSPVVWADVSREEDVSALLAQAKEAYGQVDFVVHSIGMGLNVRKDRNYDNLDYDWYHQTLDISAISLHRILHLALQSDVLAPGGSVVALTYIGAQRVFSKYSEMGDAKALLESIVRSFGYRLAERGIRINSVSQSPTRTVAGAGIKGFDTLYEFAERMSPLGNADAESCADYTITLLSDLTRKVTMQNLFHDGGFSSMGITDVLLEDFRRALEPAETA